MFLVKDENPYSDYLESMQGVAKGPDTSISNAFSGGVQESQYLMGSYGDAALYSNLYKDNVRNIETITGEKLNDFEFEYGAYRDVLNDFRGVTGNVSLQRQYHNIIEQNKKIDELKKTYPQIRSARELWDDSKSLAKTMERDSLESYERAGTLGKVANFAGSMVGSFNVENPLNVLTVGIGVGGSIIRKIVGESLVNSAVEAVNQLGFTSSSRQNLGLEETTTKEKLTQIAFAGAGAGLIVGAGHGAAKGYKALEGRILKDNPLDVLDKSLYDSGSSKRANDYINNNINMSETNKAIARQALEAENILYNNNPYDKSADGVKRFSEDYNDWVVEYETGMSRQDLMGTSSSIVLPENKILPESAIDMDTNPYTSKARAESPEVFKAIDEQQLAVDDLSKRIDDMDATLRRRVVEDTVSMSDPVLGDRLKVVNEELNSNLTKKQRVALEKERDMLVESLDVDSLSKAESDYAIGAKREIRSMRKSLDAEKRKLREVKQKGYKAIDDVVRAAKLKSIAIPSKRPTGLSTALVKSDISLDDVGKAMLSSIKKAIPQPDKIKGEPTEFKIDKFIYPSEGKISIGGKEIDLNAAMPFESVKKGDVIEIRTMTVRDMLKDLDDGDDLIKAMEYCLL